MWVTLGLPVEVLRSISWEMFKGRRGCQVNTPSDSTLIQNKRSKLESSLESLPTRLGTVPRMGWTWRKTSGCPSTVMVTICWQLHRPIAGALSSRRGAVERAAALELGELGSHSSQACDHWVSLFSSLTSALPSLKWDRWTRWCLRPSDCESLWFYDNLPARKDLWCSQGGGA